MANVVSNPKDIHYNAEKKVVSKITFNDGATWESLKSPDHDFNGLPYSCPEKECNLHLHHFTERADANDLLVF